MASEPVEDDAVDQILDRQAIQDGVQFEMRIPSPIAPPRWSGGARSSHSQAGGCRRPLGAIAIVKTVKPVAGAPRRQVRKL